MALSNNITAILNFVALMCSIPIIASGIWLASKPDNECIHWLRWPLVVLGVAFFLVSLAGFVGAYRKKQGLLGVYLVCMFILIVLLLVVLVLAFVVTRPNGAYAVPGMGFREYRLAGFSSWLRDRITGSDSWGKIRACLAESHICPKLMERYVSAADFVAARLSPIESGCCKPPMICGFQYSTPTTWVGPPNIAANTDCAIWNNDPSQLCFNCDSCKAGLLGNLRQEWRRANIILIITVVVLIWVYLIACSAYRNAQTEDLFRRYKQGWA
ncbi:tetraspanin-2 [Phtheirospermum japonicum]|uniref:Tetraspanin-2 n=1 Tax=Phtheirospermum japonicum TaxID=374723 RepID=A0A830CNM7_9LAMI|nr:tetraspanin-2 [Phtheirospermum japonicum]